MIWGLTNFDLIEVVKKDEKIDELEVWLGKKDKVSVYVKENIYKTVPRTRKKYLKAIIEYQGPILAPIKKDEVVGKLTLMYKNETIKEVDLLSLENVKKKNIISSLITSINYLIWGDV